MLQLYGKLLVFFVQVGPHILLGERCSREILVVTGKMSFGRVVRSIEIRLLVLIVASVAQSLRLVDEVLATLARCDVVFQKVLVSLHSTGFSRLEARVHLFSKGVLAAWVGQRDLTFVR